MVTSITEIDSFITTSLVIGLTQDPYGAVAAAMFYNNQWKVAKSWESRDVCSPCKFGHGIATRDAYM